MQEVPLSIHIAFALTTFLTVWLFCRAVPQGRIVWVLLLAWLAAQAAITASGFYTNTSAMPPRLVLALLPPLIGIAALFFTQSGRRYVDKLDPAACTLVHYVRVPVELVLYALFTYKAIPEGMTFAGSNFDILAGLTAPLVWWFGFKRKTLGRPWLIAWNLACIGLLANIVGRAILSAPFPFQQLAFDQPNIAIFHFPFVWLPCCVVPLVLLAHLATLRKLIRNPG